MSNAYPAGSTPKWTGTLKDESGAVVPGSAMDSMTFSLYYKASPSSTPVIVNSRSGQDALGSGSGANQVTIDSEGKITWSPLEADTLPLSVIPSTLKAWSYTFRFDIHVGVKRYIFEFPLPLSRVESLA